MKLSVGKDNSKWLINFLQKLKNYSANIITKNKYKIVLKKLLKIELIIKSKEIKSKVRKSKDIMSKIY